MQHRRIFPASAAALIAGHRSSLPGSHTTPTAAGYCTEVADGRCCDRSRKALKLGVLGAMLALGLSLSGGAFAAGKTVFVVVGASPGAEVARALHADGIEWTFVIPLSSIDPNPGHEGQRGGGRDRPATPAAAG